MQVRNLLTALLIAILAVQSTSADVTQMKVLEADESQYQGQANDQEVAQSLRNLSGEKSAVNFDEVESEEEQAEENTEGTEITEETSAEEGGEEHHTNFTSEDPEFYYFIAIATCKKIPFVRSSVQDLHDIIIFVVGCYWIVLVCFAGICSGLTVGYLGITNLQLDIILRNGTPNEKAAATSIKPLIKDHHLLLSTLLLSNAIAMEALPIFLDSICPAWVAILISTVAVVIVGEIIPQAYCTGKYQLRIGQFFAPLTRVLMKLLYIFTFPVSWILDRLLGVHDSSRLERKEDIVGLVELQEITKEDGDKAHGHGNNGKDNKNKGEQEAPRGLTDEEISLITSTMSLREKIVTKHMIPYATIYKLPENEILTSQLLEQIARKGYSNIVIHKVDNKSKVIGIIKAKSLIEYVDTKVNIPLSQVASLQEPIIISDQTNMLELMMIFQKKKSTVALVYESSKKNISENILDNLQDPKLEERLVESDKYEGFILGLVSLKDVFEVMINKDLHDEDCHQEDPYYQVIKSVPGVGAGGATGSIRRIKHSKPQFASIRRQY